MQIQIKISISPALIEPLDTLAKSMCEANDGPASARFINGLFTLPYEPVTEILDPSKMYYFDNFMVDANGQNIPQIYVWRRWGYKALDLIERLHINGLQLNEVKRITNGN